MYHLKNAHGRLYAVLAAFFLFLSFSWTFFSPPAAAQDDSESYKIEMKKRLDQIGSGIDALKDKFSADLQEAKSDAKETGQDLKQDWQSLSEELKKQQEAAAAKYEALKKASGRAWDKTRQEMDETADQLERTYNKAVKFFTK